MPEQKHKQGFQSQAAALTEGSLHLTTEIRPNSLSVSVNIKNQITDDIQRGPFTSFKEFLVLKRPPDVQHLLVYHSLGQVDGNMIPVLSFYS